MKVDIFAIGPVTLTARMYPLARTLRSLGVECHVVPPIHWDRIAKGKTGNIFSLILSYPLRKCLRAMQNPPDVLMIGKVSTPQIYILQSVLKRKEVKVLFDLTDAIFLPTGSLCGINFRTSFCLERIIRKSDFVTVNGHYLLEYVKLFNEKVAIIHDPVDTELFSPKLKNTRDKITIGWEGVPRNHYENLALLIEPLTKLAKNYDVRFKIVSYLGDLKVKEMFGKLEKLMDIDYGLERWVPMNKLPELLSDFDIMVAPLQKTSWYEGKSALRVGLGMAMEIPVVASPVGEQKHVIKHEANGFLAKDAEELYEYLKTLIENGKLRREIGRKGRETVEKELSLKVNGRRLHKIIEILAQ